jgi:hypothetical protein
VHPTSHSSSPIFKSLKLISNKLENSNNNSKVFDEVHYSVKGQQDKGTSVAVEK